MVQAAIFDLDGVIVDSMDAHFAAWTSLLSPFTKLTQSEFQSWSGMSTSDILKIVKEKYRLSDSKQDLEKEKDDLYLENLNKVKILKGVELVLRKLKGKGMLLAVATSESTQIAKELLTRFNIIDYFPIIVGKNMVVSAKPNPELFLLVAKKLGLDPKECIVVEDSPTGIKAARAAGMSSIAITNTHTKDQLKDATFTIDKIEEIDAYIR